MNFTVRIIAIVFILLGILYLAKPELVKRILEFFKQGKRIYIAGVIRLILAVVFLLAAQQCKVPWAIGVFGILLLVSGVMIFIIGAQKLKSWLEWWQKQSLLLLRALSLVTIAFGLLIIYCA